MSVFRLPDLGEGLEDAEIVSWAVAVGDEVMPGQTLASVETDKAIVEIPAVERGRVTALHGVPGERVKVGSVLVEFAGDSQADTGALVGRLPASDATRVATSVKAMPAIRAQAERLGIDIAEVNATGRSGEVTLEDVERAAAAQGAAVNGEPLRGVRRAMADKMTRAHATVVPATAMDQADIHDWWGSGADILARLIRALVAGCRASPPLNAWYDGKLRTRRLHDHVALGLAVDDAEGLFVPVIRDVANRDAVDLRSEIDRLTASVRSRRLQPEDMRGATITLSNFGALGGRFAALVVIPPQVAILGAGRVCPGLAAAPDGPVVRNILPLSLTFDHRVVTGGEAAQFLGAVVFDLERSE
jgi:pyruvate dehydrogenase E2 component (dihydrolipoamide acetyltransferase)